MNMFNLASSFPGQECTPLPNGIKVLGFGATCSHIQLKYMFREYKGIGFSKQIFVSVIYSQHNNVPQTLMGRNCEEKGGILDYDGCS